MLRMTRRICLTRLNRLGKHGKRDCLYMNYLACKPSWQKFMQTKRLGTDPASIAAAGRLLKGGGLVAFPTETVYGLGADATDPKAVARIYAAKGRPSFNPLIAHVEGTEKAYALGDFNPAARKLAEAFWPGPLTLVVPARNECAVCELARAGLETVAIRVPSHPLARALLEAAARPIAAPSANRSGHISPTLAEHVLADLDGAIDAIVDGGPCNVGLESTILACLDNHVVMLRPGAVTPAMAGAVLGHPVALPERESDTAPIAPGRLASHYAPRAPMRLDAEVIRPGEACLAYGSNVPEGSNPALTLNLSPSGQSEEAAANLYAMLRHLDSLSPTAIAVAKISKDGLGIAIFDRLRRASIPK